MKKKRKAGKKVPKRRKWLTAAGILLVLLLLPAAAALGIFKHYYNMLDYRQDELADSYEETLPSDSEKENEEYGGDIKEASEDEIAAIEERIRQNTEAIQEGQAGGDTDTFNLLLIGVDSRKDSYSGRSDAMILVSINREDKQIVMTSLLRDMYVSIPGHGSNRLNAAYAYGGSSLLTETIASNLGIRVDRCIVGNFYLVMDVIDALGGIDIPLSADEIRVMNQYISGQNVLKGKEVSEDILSEDNTGRAHLNGNQALAYARVRYVGTDFARTGRQREILSRCLDKVKQMDLGAINGLMETFLPRVRTDLTETDCASLLMLGLQLPDFEMQTMTIPMEGTWENARIRGMSVLTVDFLANTDAWYKLVGGQG